MVKCEQREFLPGRFIQLFPFLHPSTPHLISIALLVLISIPLIPPFAWQLHTHTHRVRKRERETWKGTEPGAD